MARTLPVSPDSSVVNPSFSALASLGLEESVVVLGSVDGPGADAIAIPNLAPQLVPLWVPVESSFEGTNPVPAATPVAPVEPVEATWGASAVETLSPADVIDGQVADSPSDSVATMIWVPINLSGDERGQPVVVERGDDLSFIDRKTGVEFRSDGLAGSPDFGADSMPFDAAAAARPSGGGGGTGGGGSTGTVVPEYKSGSVDVAGYDIWIQFKGSGWTAELQSAFKNAADYFTKVITDDIGGGGRIGKVVVDDLLVTAEVKAIDGVGGILGQAGPSHVWTALDLTADGSMQFDIADAQTYLGLGLWDDIVTHELMHVLGVGSLWNYGDHVGLVSGGQYTGRFALEAYQETHPEAAFIPVEQEGGAGTAGSHWDEQALVNELMTGYINNDGNAATVNDNILSKFSVMSLADLGYKVAYTDYSYDGTPS